MSMELSDDREKVLILLQLCAASLSLIGSCTIVFKILRGLYRNHTTTPYDRIILGLSSCDIVASITYGIGPFLLPSDTSLRVWTFGTAATCQGLGFFNQASAIWSMWYNCILSYYYLLTVRFQVKQKQFCRKYEIWMHLSGLFFPITATIGYYGEWYFEQDLYMNCWIKDPNIGYIFAAVPMVITFLSLIINNAIIYSFVRKLLRSNEASQKRLKWEAATQGFLYVACFFGSTTPIFVLQIMGGPFQYTTDDQGKIYPLLVLNSMLLPLQGFFNVFIYIKPVYTRFRAANPDKSMYLILQQALFDPNIPKLTSSSNDPSSSSNNAVLKLQAAPSRSGIKSAGNFTMGLECIAEGDGSTSDLNLKPNNNVKEEESDRNFTANATDEEQLAHA